MNNVAQANIRWLSKEEGGRLDLPHHLHHILVSRFEDTAATWPQQAWSLVVDFSSSPRSDRAILAEIRFLSSQGPIELFYPGSYFELLDGYKVVAQGEVL